MAQRRRTPGRSSNRRRSWQVPLSVAVIVISVIAIWRLSGGLFDDDGGATTPAEPDAAISAFWVDRGRDLLTDWRQTSPMIVQNIAIGRDCIQSEELKPAVCPDLPQEFEGHRVALAALMERANSLERPEDSTADEWLTKLVAAWSNLEQSLGTYAQLALEGYEDEPWLAHQAEYRELVIPGFDEAEFALARVLAQVEPELLGVPAQ